MLPWLDPWWPTIDNKAFFTTTNETQPVGLVLSRKCSIEVGDPNPEEPSIVSSPLESKEDLGLENRVLRLWKCEDKGVCGAEDVDVATDEENEETDDEDADESDGEIWLFLKLRLRKMVSKKRFGFEVFLSVMDLFFFLAFR